MQTITKLICAILLFINVLLLFRVYVFEPFYIPSPSMVGTLAQGDVVLVNKWKFRKGKKRKRGDEGMRHAEAVGHTEEVLAEVGEMGSDVERGQVLVFHPPWNQEKLYFTKRCIGLPGDSLALCQHHMYRVEDGVLWKEEWENRTTAQRAEPVPLAHQRFKYYYVPQRGDTLPLPTGRKARYHKSLVAYEHLRWQEEEKQYYRAGKPIDFVVLQHNYYFMLGDNRPNSNDSRYWGVVPECNVVGAVVGILWSRDAHTQQIRWNRIGPLARGALVFE